MSTYPKKPSRAAAIKKEGGGREAVAGAAIYCAYLPGPTDGGDGKGRRRRFRIIMVGERERGRCGETFFTRWEGEVRRKGTRGTLPLCGNFVQNGRTLP